MSRNGLKVAQEVRLRPTGDLYELHVGERGSRRLLTLDLRLQEQGHLDPWLPQGLLPGDWCLGFMKTDPKPYVSDVK